jgi:hypothetical protein
MSISYKLCKLRVLACASIGLCCTVALHSNAQESASPQVNAGHYQIGPFEYFAEERLEQKGESTKPKSRLWLMPTLILIPETLGVYKASGEEYELKQSDDRPEKKTISSSVPSRRHPRGSFHSHTEQIAPDVEPELYNGRLVFRATPAALTPLAKALILAHMMNDSSLRQLPANDLFYRNAALAQPPLVEQLSMQSPEIQKLFENTEKYANVYRMEIATAKRVVAKVYCNGMQVGEVKFSPGSILSSTSTIAVDCPSLTKATAIHFYEGRISITTDMEIDLTNVQIAVAEYNLNTFAEAVSNELYDRVTEAKNKKTGFLFWGSTERTVETWMNSSIARTAQQSTSEQKNLFLRDVSNPRLVDAAMNYIFKPIDLASADRLSKMAEDHRLAAIEAEKGNRKELAEAHRRYADYVLSLRQGSENSDLATKAMEALEKIFSGKSDQSGGAQPGAGPAVAVSSGNPYVAAAMFLAQGIVFKDDRSSDRLHVAQTNRAEWKESHNKYFSGLVATQTAAGFTVTQGYFPEIMQLREEKKPINPDSVRQQQESSLRISLGM